MYKDKDKQKEANRQASKKYRDSMTGKGMTVIIPKTDIRVIPKPKGMTDVEIMQGMTKPDSIRTTENNAGQDILHDYRVLDKCAPPILEPKRGKDIKYFGDLPVYVQEDINRMSFVDGKFSETVKANRTAIAINYQHQFPDRFHSVGVAI